MSAIPPASSPAAVRGARPSEPDDGYCERGDDPDRGADSARQDPRDQPEERLVGRVGDGSGDALTLVDLTGPEIDRRRGDDDGGEHRARREGDHRGDGGASAAGDPEVHTEHAGRELERGGDAHQRPLAAAIAKPVEVEQTEQHQEDVHLAVEDVLDQRMGEQGDGDDASERQRLP